MATGFYSLSGVTVAGGGTTLTAAQIALPGGSPDPSNFLNLIGADGTDGTPAGALILGPAGQVGIVRHAVNATTLQLSKAWVGAAITGGSAEIILGINALPVGRLATLITQIITLRPLLKASNLAEYAGDGTAQAAILSNLGLDALALLVDRVQSLNSTKQTQGRRNLGLTASGDLVSMAASVAAIRSALQITAAGEALLLATTAAIQRSALGANTPGSAIFTGATAAGQALATAANLAAQKTLLGLDALGEELVTSGSVTSSTATTPELTLPAGYKSFRLVLRNARPVADGGFLGLQFKKSGSWKTASSDYTWNQTYWSTSAFSSWNQSGGSSSLLVLVGSAGVAASLSGLATIAIEPGDGTFQTSVISQFMQAQNGAAGNGATAAAGRAEAVRALFSSGNIGNLQYELYGLRG